MSATNAKLGVRKFSTEINRGYPRARMISVKSAGRSVEKGGS